MRLTFPNLKNTSWSVEVGLNDVRVEARAAVEGQTLGVSHRIDLYACSGPYADSMGEHVVRELTRDLISAAGRTALGLPLN